MIFEKDMAQKFMDQVPYDAEFWTTSIEVNKTYLQAALGKKSCDITGVNIPFMICVFLSQLIFQ